MCNKIHTKAGHITQQFCDTPTLCDTTPNIDLPYSEKLCAIRESRTWLKSGILHTPNLSPEAFMLCEIHLTVWPPVGLPLVG